ncbi:putative zinc transporter 10 [Hibiscus syriacus]|uniref:Zinc transporter 10 n=1 Tax=Hibiscus syriacus TaxID=106335 RepID=A0A6A2XPM8_HIBSY|nr:putative zinc transporter 10 [Hibiscus syriacus]
MIGVCLPLLSRYMPSLAPDSDMFAVVKAFASGKKFPFTAFVAMISALLTLMVDSFAMSVYKKHCSRASDVDANNGSIQENRSVTTENSEHGHGPALEMNHKLSQLLRHRVIAQVLELGIVVHSVVIGLAMGASDNRCTIRLLIAALCFHQMFEGMGLGGCILQAEYEFQMKAIMVFFFSVTTPLGIVLGIGLTKVYSATSPTALIVVGLLNASSAGLLNYMALVDLLAADFLGPKLQKNMKVQAWSYVAVLLGSGFMSLMAKWA